MNRVQSRPGPRALIKILKQITSDNIGKILLECEALKRSKRAAERLAKWMSFESLKKKKRDEKFIRFFFFFRRLISSIRPFDRDDFLNFPIHAFFFFFLLFLHDRLNHLDLIVTSY